MSSDPQPAMSDTGTNTDHGHGHVWPRPDGMVARCGGPGICSECDRDAARMKRREDDARIDAEIAAGRAKVEASLDKLQRDIAEARAELEAIGKPEQEKPT